MAYTNNFSFRGTIFEKKEDDKHKNKSVLKSKKSEWVMAKYTFGMKTCGSFHNVTVQGGYMNSDKGVIYYITNKKEKKSVPFKKRFTVDLDEVAPFCLYTLNLNEHRKSDLEAASKNSEAALKMNMTCDQAQEYLNNYEANRHRYLSSADLVNDVEQVVQDPKYKGKQFTVTGNVLFNEYNDKVYTTFEARNVTLNAVEADEKSAANIYFLMNEDSMGEIEDDGSFIMKGWTAGYDSKEKKQVYYPYDFRVEKVIKDTEADMERANTFRRKRFTVKGDTIKECVVTTEVINGTTFRKITEDDLTDEERDAIFCGEVTLEDLQKEYQNIAGPAIRENRFVKMGSGYSKGPLETNMKIEDILGIADAEEADDDIDDLFGDD